VVGTAAAAGTTAALSDAGFTQAQLVGTIVGAGAKLAGGDVLDIYDVSNLAGGATVDEFGNLLSDFSLADYLPSSETFSNLTSIAAPIIGAFAQPVANPIPSMYPGNPVPAQPYPVAQVPMVQRAVTAGLPRWSAMVPSLWQFVRTKFPMMSPSTAVTGLMSLLSKYGPTALSSFIGAAVVSELLGYKVTKKRRRMNVANTRALRRSLRRLKGFNRLSHRVSAQLGRGGMRRTARRCSTCRRSPCCC
jgi:hypothetical protein